MGVVIPPSNSSTVRFNMADSAVIQLPDGTWRMYFGNFSEPVNQYNTISGGSIDSATSSDGVHWTLDQGARVTSQFYCPPAVNSVLMLANGTIRLYGGCQNVYDSNDGLHFVQLSRTVQAPDVPGSTGPGSYTIVPLTDGRYRMYMDQTFNGTDPRSTIVRIYSYVSTDGFTFAQEPGVRLDSPLQYGSSVIRSRGHPLVYHLSNGTWIMYFDTATIMPPVAPLPGDPSTNANPTGVALSQDGLAWKISRPTFIESGESYQLTTSRSGLSVMVFGYYGQPQFPMPPYAKYYGGGLYYALPYYHVIVGGKSYAAEVRTNSTISAWTFDIASQTTAFNMSSSGPGFLNFSFPSSLIPGQVGVSLDGAPIAGAITQNSSDYSVHVGFQAGTHQLSLTGTQPTATSSVSQTQTTLTTSTAPTVTSTTRAATGSTVGQATSTSLSPTGATTTQTQTAAGGASPAQNPGGIPEFPAEALAASVFVSLLVASYLVARRRQA